VHRRHIQLVDFLEPITTLTGEESKACAVGAHGEGRGGERTASTRSISAGAEPKPEEESDGDRQTASNADVWSRKADSDVFVNDIQTVTNLRYKKLSLTETESNCSEIISETKANHKS